jgi:hypothetical protein
MNPSHKERYNPLAPRFFAVGKLHRPMDAKLTGEALAASRSFLLRDSIVMLFSRAYGGVSVDSIDNSKATGAQNPLLASPNRSDCVRVAMVATTFHAGRSRYSAAVVSIVVIRILLVGCALRLAPPRRVSGHRSEKATFHPSGKYPLKISEHWRVFQYRFWFFRRK